MKHMVFVLIFIICMILTLLLFLPKQLATLGKRAKADWANHSQTRLLVWFSVALDFWGTLELPVKLSEDTPRLPLYVHVTSSVPLFATYFL